jgi:hypothetical protein
MAVMVVPGLEIQEWNRRMKIRSENWVATTENCFAGSVVGIQIRGSGKCIQAH